MHKVSFILAAYKTRFLRETIVSILSQTYRDFELVVVDDCSPEDMKSVVDQFSDDRVSYHRNESNIGGHDLVEAWNEAMKFARGEFVILASDDDVYAPTYLEEMIVLSERYPEVNIYHCRIGAIDSSGEIIWVGAPRSEYETPAEMFYHTVISGIQLRAPDVMFRVNALSAIGGFVNFPKAWYSDIATWVSLAESNGACCARDVLFYWRESGENISNQFGDVGLKIAASNSFIKFALQFLERINPRSKIDEFMIEDSRRRLNSTVENQLRCMMRMAPLKCWVIGISNSCLSCKCKLKMFLDKLKMIIIGR